MLEGLGHHRVGEHGQDRAAREREHERERAGARRVEDRVAQQRRQPADERHEHPEAEDPAAPPAGGREPVVAAIASGRFERNTAASTATLTPAPSSSPSPITADSGMPSRTIPSTIARAEPAPAVAAHLLAVLAAHPVDEHVADEEHQGACREPEREAAVPRRGLEGLRHELVGDGADQDAGAERHDQAEQALADREHESEDSAEDQRRAGKNTPEKCRPHQTAASDGGRT